jgi:hypothetical protein
LGWCSIHHPSADLSRLGRHHLIRGHLLQPVAHPLAIGNPSRPLLQQGEYPSENRADHNTSKRIHYFCVPVPAGHRKLPAHSIRKWEIPDVGPVDAARIMTEVEQTFAMIGQRTDILLTTLGLS